MPPPPELLTSAATNRPQPRVAAFITRTWLAGAAIFLLGCYCAYRLPFHFPPQAFALSNSYIYGFNNKVAIAALLSIGVAVTIWSAWTAARARTQPAAVHDSRRIPLWLLLTIALFNAAWIATLSWLVLTSSTVSVEDFYFIPQLEKHVFYHRHIYTQIEFAYGPLLFYFPVWIYHLLSPWRVSIDSAYYVALIVEHLIGLGFLYAIANVLPCPRTTRTVTFCTIAVFGFNQLLGANYTLFRFLFPYFGLVVVARSKQSWRPAICCIGVITGLAISSEVGVAFATGTIIYAILLAGDSRKSALIAVVSTVVPFAVWMGLWGHIYLTTLSHFSHGYGNNIVQPSLLSLLLIAAVSWICPRAAGVRLLERTSVGRLLVGFFAISLALLPAVFSSADLLHEFANGLGLLLLSAVALSATRVGRIGWGCALCVVCLMFLKWSFVDCTPRFAPGLARVDPSHRLANALYPISHTIGASLRSVSPYTRVSLAAIEPVVGHQEYAIPISIFRPEVLPLLRAPNFSPSYFEGRINLWGPDAQEIKIQEMRSVPWLIAPLNRQVLAITGSHHSIAVDNLIMAEIRDHWSLVTILPNDLGLYHQNK